MRMRLIITALFMLSGVAVSQDNLRTELFKEADPLYQQVKNRHAELYAPGAYARATEYYTAADEAYRKEKKIEDIREKVKNACAYFAKALDAADRAARIFNTVIIARDDAVSAGAPASQAELWKKAESEFNQAARSLEGGDSVSVKGRLSVLEAGYRTAELEAIKSNYLTPARLLIQRADAGNVADDAPVTLTKAKTLVADVERLLQQNRRDADQARMLAGEAKYEAAHAIALSKKIREMKADDRQMEKNLLAGEEQLLRIGAVLGIQTGFENGPDAPVAEMVNGIKDRDARITADADSLRRLSDLLATKDLEITNLNQQISSMQARVGTLTDNEKQLQEKLNVQRDREQIVRSVGSSFAPEEGNVLRDGDNIILRLYGLTFQSGKSDLESQYYPLLTRVQEAIRKFGNCAVRIEGHTDSKGNERINQTLSEARARAVAEYLMANMGVTVPIPSEGFGDTKPVATNNTSEGRARNRRIDVIITPEWK